MNIKKNIMKTMCAALACTTIMSNLISVCATETIITESPMDESVGSGSDWIADEGNLEEIEVTYTQASSYNVTIPKTIALDTSKQAVYSVKVTGDIDVNERVHVVPVDGISGTEGIDFYMKDQTPDSKKADVVATVTQTKFYWNSEDVANGYEETNNSVSAPKLTAGTWKGTFQIAINLETMAEQPETDPYETAPANAYTSWNYTLDNNNNIITLNYYRGSETDVIVYANYVIGGKTYKTQIASSANGNNSINYMFNGYGDGQNGCQKIQSIAFSKNIDTSNVTNMSYMFYSCGTLTSLDLGNLDTSNVSAMDSVFGLCSSLAYVDLSGFDTSNVKSMKGMFQGAISLTSLDLSNFDTNNVTSMNYMFYDCRKLTDIYVSRDKWSTSNATTNSMFSSCGTSSVTYK